VSNKKRLKRKKSGEGEFCFVEEDSGKNLNLVRSNVQMDEGTSWFIKRSQISMWSSL